MPIPSTYKYTPEQYSALIDEFIRKCKEKEDGYIACPEQLFMHTGLSKSRISEYRNKPSDEAYREATEKAYNFMGIEGWKDLKDGNGRYGQNIIGRVLKHSEISETKFSGDITLTERIRRAVDESQD